MTTSPKTIPTNPLSAENVRQLESQGCLSTDWTKVTLSPETDLSLIRNVRFEGDVSIGRLIPDSSRSTGIFNAVIADCRIGNQVYIRNVGCRLSGYRIADRVNIENVGRIEGSADASCGVGTEVAVLDETGSRAVRIFPGLSATMALLMAMNPRWAEELDAAAISPLAITGVPAIGTGAGIYNCGEIVNVNIDRDVTVCGAVELRDGSIVNNAPRGTSAARVGSGVIARGFIIEDGVADTSARLFNCYVGQKAVISNGFTAHDSLFFANSHCENGEACAIIAGPYTVSMHKSSLLIGGLYSFMNAGSGTNFSNHLYKLGPVHWGIAERGVKTSSNGYLMWGARIGAFSMMMGEHKSHPDTSLFPFSYLFPGKRGETVVIPARMLASSGLMRDETKWPLRDARTAARLPLHDHIDFDTLNPCTVARMIQAAEILKRHKTENPDSDLRMRGMYIPAESIGKSIGLYMLAIKKYYFEKCKVYGMPSPYDAREDEWVDLCGQLLPRKVMDRVLDSETIQEAMEILDEAAADFASDEKGWIAWKFSGSLLTEMDDAADAARQFDEMREADRKDYVATLAAENTMLKM